MKKKNVIFSCVAVAAIAAFVGMKTLGLHADESNSLLKQNVEALSEDEYAIVGKVATPGLTECVVYVDGILRRGRYSVCNEIASLNEFCVPGVCMAN